MSSIVLSVVYVDLPDLIELRTEVRSGDWSGAATAYTGPDSLRAKAATLQAWAARPSGECRIEAGADTGIGGLILRFYTIDRAGHAVCHVTLASMASTGGRPEEVSRLSLEMRTEPGLVERFARQLSSLSNVLSGEAVLEGP